MGKWPTRATSWGKVQGGIALTHACRLKSLADMHFGGCAGPHGSLQVGRRVAGRVAVRHSGREGRRRGGRTAGEHDMEEDAHSSEEAGRIASRQVRRDRHQGQRLRIFLTSDRGVHAFRAAGPCTDREYTLKPECGRGTLSDFVWRPRRCRAPIPALQQLPRFAAGRRPRSQRGRTGRAPLPAPAFLGSPCANGARRGRRAIRIFSFRSGRWPHKVADDRRHLQVCA